mgnify:CR=1 FL=1
MNGRTNIGDLSKAARVLQAARMLPMKGELTELQREEVRKLYSQHCYRFDIADATAAKAIGRAASTISQWKNGKYRGDNDELTRALNNWIERDLRQRVAGLDTEYIATWVAEGMAAIIDTAIEERCMTALVVPAGAGKTLVLETKTGETAGFYVYADEDDTAVKFLAKLARAVGIDPEKPRRRTAADIKAAIIERISGTGRPIYIDEAHRLPPQCFGRVRSIHDQTGSPIVMAGTHDILNRIDDRAGSAGQMASRCLIWNALEHVINADRPDGGSALGRPLFTRDEVRKFLEQQKVKLSRDGFEMAWALACLPGHGCLRLVGRLVRVCKRMNGGGQLTAQQLSDVLSMLFGNQGRAVAASAKRHLSIAANAASAA